MSTPVDPVITNVLIIGNGGAGSQTAACFSEIIKRKKLRCKLTVLSPCDYTEVSVCMTKNMVVAGAHASSLYASVREPGVDYLIDGCKELKPDSLITTCGKELYFDVCIVATGQNIPVFMPASDQTARVDRERFILSYVEKINAAKHVVISGGGAIGSELAADIKVRLPGVRVTLVHAYPSILNTMSPDFHELSNRLISSPAIGVELVLNDRVQSHADGKVVLQSGTVLQCDVFIPAHSTGGNVGFMPSCTLSGMSARSSGYVDVNDFFQVRHPDYHRVFAIGDCSNFDPIKTYVRIQDQAPTLCHNVAAMVLAQPMKAHVRCKSMQGQIPGPMMVVFGHDHSNGVGIGPDFPPGSCMSSATWCVCCCQAPHGKLVAGAKSDFNRTIQPRVGRGIASYCDLLSFL